MRGLKISNSDFDWNPKYLWLFGGMFVTSYIMSIILAAKVFVLGSVTLTAGIMVYPIVCILGDVLTEVYGFNNARKIIWLAFVANLFMLALIQLTMMLPTALNPNVDTSIQTLFAQTSRLVFAGLFAYLVSEFTNSYIVSRMKIKQEAKGFSKRAIASTVVGQFFDSFLFCVISFAYVIPFENLVSLVLASWFIKIVYEVLALPVTIKVVSYMKQKEGVEHFDKDKISII